MIYKGLNVNLKDVQKEELEILVEFDRICKKNNLKYQLFAGTLLGSIRHKGFIPWDDDIDVCMLREDYDKFLKVCNNDLKSSKYFLQTYNTDKNYNRQFAKIRKNNTLFIEKSFIDSKIHQGFYIDIFALDSVSPNTLMGKLHRYALYILSRIHLLRVKRFCLELKNPIKRFYALSLHYILKAIPKIWTDRLTTNISTVFNNSNKKYVSHLQNGVTKTRYLKYMMEKEKFYETIDGEFEGLKFPIPKNYDSILSKLFGKYQELPPIDQQQPHHGIVEIKFNTKN